MIGRTARLAVNSPAPPLDVESSARPVEVESSSRLLARSIRRRLLVFLLPPLTALMLAGVFVDYRAAMIFARTTYDQRLADAALALAAQIDLSDGQVHARAPRPEPTTGIERDARFYYSVIDPAGHVVLGSGLLAAAPRGSSNPAFADRSLGGQPVRVATYRLPTAAGIATITVAGTDDSRTGPVHFILGSTWLIGFIQLDITLLLVWLGVHFGLRPLLKLREQIEARSARELRPLETATVPAEVRPLVDALNLLFEMLGESARAQRQFVADTAHQLRTPLAGLLGNLEVLMREHPEEPLHDRLTAMHEGMSRLAHSANQLLSLGRADPSASLTDEFVPVDLRALASRIVERHVDRSVQNGLDIGAEVSAAETPGSPRLLEDLLGNLVDNALNYTPAGGHITVRSGVFRSAAGSAQPFLEVEDDGPGIPESERTRVRERFYRLPGSPGPGCGLGLAIVDEIARLHGADLTIEAGAGGRGTRIRVLFAA